jgi:hypothetical protein
MFQLGDKWDLNHNFMSDPYSPVYQALCYGLEHCMLLWLQKYSTTCRHWSMACWALSLKVWLAVSVDLIFVNPFCASDKILCLFIKDINLLHINFSNVLGKTGKKDIGQ